MLVGAADCRHYQELLHSYISLRLFCLALPQALARGGPQQRILARWRGSPWERQRGYADSGQPETAVPSTRAAVKSDEFRCLGPARSRMSSHFAEEQKGFAVAKGSGGPARSCCPSGRASRAAGEVGRAVACAVWSAPCSLDPPPRGLASTCTIKAPSLQLPNSVVEKRHRGGRGGDERWDAPRVREKMEGR